MSIGPNIIAVLVHGRGSTRSSKIGCVRELDDEFKLTLMRRQIGHANICIAARLFKMRFLFGLY